MRSATTRPAGGRRPRSWVLVALSMPLSTALSALVVPGEVVAAAPVVPVSAAACVPAREPVPHGPPDADSPCDVNVTPSGTSYVPGPIDMRAERPYIPLDDYRATPASSPVAQRFKAYVDAAVAGRPDYGYTPADAVVMYARTGQRSYLDSAIRDVDAEVRQAERAIAGGGAPWFAGDSYLDVGWAIEQLAFVYDWGHTLLTPAQRARWKALGDQAIANVWSPRLASWGGAPAGTHAWSGWAVNDVGNNYSFSFVEATQLWALATHDETWIRWLQRYKFPLITDYYTRLRGGGSREGTGCGAAQSRLWRNARTLAAGTGERLVAVERHAQESIDYWVHATTPRRDMFAPVGDQSRESLPRLYDYHENLVREAAMAAPRTAATNRALWWLDRNSVPTTLAHARNLRTALLRPEGTPTAPTATSYHASGAGALFARSGWGRGATWLALVAGPYDQSHAHQEQGSFTLYHRGGWDVVTPNIWSRSGLQGNGNPPYLGTEVGSLVRFDKPGPDGATVRQRYSRSSLSVRRTQRSLVAKADLSPAYPDAVVRSWTRRLELTRHRLSVRDRCTVGAGVTATWQLQVPTEPRLGRVGRVRAGDLVLRFPGRYRVAWQSMPSLEPDIGAGWRVELTNPRACRFEVELLMRPRRR